MPIYIIRHGETQANEQGYLQGWSNDPLNENGRRLAVLTGLALSDIIFDYCISSPLIRAKETAEIILRESGNNIQIQLDDRIKEIGFGRYERADIRGTEVAGFLVEPNIEYQFPEGESILQVMKPTQKFLKELIIKDDGKNYLISTHGCALRAMLNYLYENPDDFWHGHVPYNCCVNIVGAKNGIGTLLADDRVYYDQNLIIDRYYVDN